MLRGRHWFSADVGSRTRVGPAPRGPGSFLFPDNLVVVIGILRRMPMGRVSTRPGSVLPRRGGRRSRRPPLFEREKYRAFEWGRRACRR